MDVRLPCAHRSWPPSSPLGSLARSATVAIIVWEYRRLATCAPLAVRRTFGGASAIKCWPLPRGSPADAQGADYNNDEGHATDVASPDRDRNPLTRVSCWARRPRSRRQCAEAPAYKLLESRVLSSFVFLDTTRHHEIEMCHSFSHRIGYTSRT